MLLHQPPRLLEHTGSHELLQQPWDESPQHLFCLTLLVMRPSFLPKTISLLPDGCLPPQLMSPWRLHCPLRHFFDP